MASPHLYGNSMAGLDANSGATWLLAKATAAGLAAIDTTTDNRLWLADTHNESNAGVITLNFAGTLALPTWLVAANSLSGEPPTTLATASITTTGAGSITINGNCVVIGVTFNCGTTATASQLIQSGTAASERQWYKNCNFNMVGTTAACTINIGAAASIYEPKIRWDNCNVNFKNAAAGIDVRLGALTWDGGSVSSGSTALTGGMFKFTGTSRSAKARVSGVNLENIGVAAYLVAVGGGNTVDAEFSNCKLPAGWTGTPTLGTLQVGDRVVMWDSDNADTTGRYWAVTYEGEVRSESVVILGASTSFKMTSAANAEYPILFLESPRISKRNTVIGTPITVTIETVTDGVTLTNDECAVEVMYLGTNGFPLALFVNDEKTNVLSTAAAKTTSSAAWTTTGLTTPVKQKHSVTFTPQEVGNFVAKLKLYKPSTTIYVDRNLVQT